ncbi:hypothetical protein ACH4OW_13985 [Streptomyces sp. NPDC017056]|uniref:hypothetical protein n=1 Tax=Streptomyces sp. NPDC017056 TaxID=3364973 RepID=UPI0037B4D2BC
MPVCPPRALVRATVSAALLAAVSLACPAAAATEGAGQGAGERVAAAPFPSAGEAARAPARPDHPPHLADTGSASVSRVGAAALVFLSAGALLVTAARRFRRR